MMSGFDDMYHAISGGETWKAQAARIATKAAGGSETAQEVAAFAGDFAGGLIGGGSAAAKVVKSLGKTDDLARAGGKADDLARLGNTADNVVAPSNRLLGSIEDAASFERRHFANRFVNENTLSDVQGSIESAFSGRGMTFDGIFTGQSSSRFIPRFDDAGNIVGGRINLVGSSQRQPMVRVLDEVTHALDAVHPRFQSRFERLMQIGAVDPDRARVFQHYQLFRRAANQFEAGDSTLRLLLQEGDADLLRRLATELRR